MKLLKYLKSLEKDENYQEFRSAQLAIVEKKSENSSSTPKEITERIDLLLKEANKLLKRESVSQKYKFTLTNESGKDIESLPLKNERKNFLRLHQMELNDKLAKLQREFEESLNKT